MSDPPEPRAKSPALAAVVLVVVFLVLLSLYVLSIGPAVWLVRHKIIGGDDDSLVSTIYAPILFAINHSEAFRRAYEWYASFWR